MAWEALVPGSKCNDMPCAIPNICYSPKLIEAPTLELCIPPWYNPLGQETPYHCFNMSTMSSTFFLVLAFVVGIVVAVSITYCRRLRRISSRSTREPPLVPARPSVRQPPPAYNLQHHPREYIPLISVICNSVHPYSQQLCVSSPTTCKLCAMNFF